MSSIISHSLVFGFLLQFAEANPIFSRQSGPLPDLKCGQAGSRGSKILSGEDAAPYEFPWMVSIKSNVNEGAGNSHFCGGFVVNNRAIISAAHCFFRKYNSHLNYTAQGIALPSSISVTLGQHDLSGADAMLFKTTIESISLHPDFEKGGHLNNDIAVLRTSSDIRWDSGKLNNDNPTICLPPSGDSSNELFGTGDLVTVAGWGNTNCHNSKIRPSKTLKKVSIPIWQESDCLQAYQDAHYDFTREDYVCAGDDQKDSSKGDSGSPLMLLQNNQWTAIGIVSAGRFMCEDRVPGVYTKISSYLEWIHSQIN